MPVGDSSFIRGVFVAQEGSSPDQMHAYQEQVGRGAARQSGRGHDLHDDREFSAFFPANQGFLLAFLKDPDKRPPILAVAGQLMGAINSSGAGTADFLQPNPVLQISTGATANLQGQFAYAHSGIDPNEVYAIAGQVDRQRCSVSRISVRQLRSLQSHAQPAGGYPARSGQALRRVRDAHSRPAAQRLFAELHLSDQEARTISTR